MDEKFHMEQYDSSEWDKITQMKLLVNPISSMCYYPFMLSISSICVSFILVVHMVNCIHVVKLIHKHNAILSSTVSFINMSNCMWYRFHPLSLSMPWIIHPTNFYHKFIQHLRFIDFIHIWSVHLCGDLPWWNNVRFYLKYVRLWDCLLHASLFSNLIYSTTFLPFIFLPASLPFLSLWLPMNHLPGQYPTLSFPFWSLPCTCCPLFLPPHTPTHLRVGTLQAVQRVCCLLGWHGKLCSTK